MNTAIFLAVSLVIVESYRPAKAVGAHTFAQRKDTDAGSPAVSVSPIDKSHPSRFVS